MAAAVTLPLSRAVRQITLEVRFTGARRAAWRIWAAAQIMKLAALVAGCGIEIETGKGDDRR